MNWNDSDVGYTFWDEMWNETEKGEKGKQRREGTSPKDTAEDDLA